MPRHKAIVPPVRQKVCIPEDLMLEVDKRLWDPLFKRRRYGALSETICSLLKEWVKDTPVNPIAEEHFRKEQEDAAADL